MKGLNKRFPREKDNKLLCQNAKAMVYKPTETCSKFNLSTNLLNSHIYHGMSFVNFVIVTLRISKYMAQSGKA